MITEHFTEKYNGGSLSANQANVAGFYSPGGRITRAAVRAPNVSIGTHYFNLYINGNPQFVPAANGFGVSAAGAAEKTGLAIDTEPGDYVQFDLVQKGSGNVPAPIFFETDIDDGVSAAEFRATINAANLEILQKTKSENYTFDATDSGGQVLHPGTDADPRTYTIPDDADDPLPIGTAITIVNQAGGGPVTIGITNDTLVLAGDGAEGARTLTAPGVATILKIDSTEWMISGVGLS